MSAVKVNGKNPIFKEFSVISSPLLVEHCPDRILGHDYSASWFHSQHFLIVVYSL
jgi:hypothetical protein